MKIFGINFGSNNVAGLNPGQMMLRAALVPHFKNIKAAGYSLKDAGFALRSHFERTQERITTERAAELLKDPEKLILDYRKATGKPNNLSQVQAVVLKEILQEPAHQQRARAFIAANLVAEAIPPIMFKEMLLQLLACRFSPAPALLAQWTRRTPAV
jgi:hypothetical protein